MSISERREKEKQERITRIQNAAIKLFSGQGYKETTMDNIAQEAELGKGTVYYYFATKEEIFWSVFEKITTEFYNGIQSSVETSGSLIDYIKKIFRYYVDWFSGNPEQLQIMFPLGKNSPLGEETIADARFLNHRTPLLATLDRFVKKEDIPISGEQLARAIWNYLMGISLQMIKRVDRQRIDADLELFIEMLKIKIKETKSGSQT